MQERGFPNPSCQVGWKTEEKEYFRLPRMGVPGQPFGNFPLLLHFLSYILQSSDTRDSINFSEIGCSAVTETGKICFGIMLSISVSTANRPGYQSLGDELEYLFHVLSGLGTCKIIGRIKSSRNLANLSLRHHNINLEV